MIELKEKEELNKDRNEGRKTKEIKKGRGRESEIKRETEKKEKI